MYESNTIKKINYFYDELDRLEESLSWLEHKIEHCTSEEDSKYLYSQVVDEKKKYEILNREFMAHLAILSQQ
jgi:hypothetical protein